MKEKIIKIYDFDELKPEIQEKVINKFREYNDYSFLEYELKEELKYILIQEKIKYEDIPEILYSLSNCQGDGACFVGELTYKKINVKIKHNSHYYHEKSVDFYFYNESGKDTENKTTEQFKELYIKICKRLEKYGYDLIEDANNKDNIEENIRDNHYMFRENGEIESY